MYNASVSRDIVQPSLISPPLSSCSLYIAATTVGRRNVNLQVNARHLPEFEILIKIKYIQFFSLLNVKKKIITTLVVHSKSCLPNSLSSLHNEVKITKFL